MGYFSDKMGGRRALSAAIGMYVIGFAPKTATVVVNAVPRAFDYVLGDSMAKVLLGRIADPTKDGVTILGGTSTGGPLPSRY